MNARRIRRGDSSLMSFAPVAHDAAGLQLYCEILASEELSTESAVRMASGWLEAAAGLGVGTNDPAHMDLVALHPA
jgi:hypothetical protein